MKAAIGVDLGLLNGALNRQPTLTLEHGPQDIDGQLLQGCLRGKARAQEKLYKLFYGYAMSIALRYAKDPEEGKDILNESFLKVFTKLDTYDASKSFKAWLRRIVVNTSIDYYRSQKKYQHDVPLESAYAVNADAAGAISQLTAEEILAMLHQLPEQQRLIFNLYEIEGYSHREIAEQLEIPEGTSRSSLTRARQQLREIFFTNYQKDYEGSI